MNLLTILQDGTTSLLNTGQRIGLMRHIPLPAFITSILTPFHLAFRKHHLFYLHSTRLFLRFSLPTLLFKQFMTTPQLPTMHPSLQSPSLL